MFKKEAEDTVRAERIIRIYTNKTVVIILDEENEK